MPARARKLRTSPAAVQSADIAWAAADVLTAAAQATGSPELQQAAEGFTQGRDPCNKKSLARCLVYMGRCARTLGRTHDAVRYHEAAKIFFQELRYQEGQSQLLNSLGLSYMALGRFDDAEQSFHQALSQARQRSAGARRRQRCVEHERPSRTDHVVRDLGRCQHCPTLGAQRLRQRHRPDDIALST